MANFIATESLTTLPTDTVLTTNSTPTSIAVMLLVESVSICSTESIERFSSSSPLVTLPTSGQIYPNPISG